MSDTATLDDPVMIPPPPGQTPEEATNAQIESTMRAQGVPVEQRQKRNYFGPGEVYRITLPDSDDHVWAKEFQEGDRRKYSGLINRDIRVIKGTGDALLRGPAGEERAALLKVALTDWDLEDENSNALPFNPRNLEKFLTTAPPEVIDFIDKEIREREPWLTGEPTVEEIDAEIEHLQELREEALKREEGKASS